MRILVTGAGGFVGAALVKAAIARGWDVVAVTRAERPERLARVAGSIVQARADMADTDALRAILLSERPDVVVHSAWAGLSGEMRGQRGQIADNVDAACRLVEAAADAKVTRFVGIGSQAEYGRLDRRATEADLPEPASLYGAAKLATLHLTRQLCHTSGMGFAWARLFATYGPGDNPNWLIPSLIARMAVGERPAMSPGTQKWDYLYIDDAALALVGLAATRNAEGVFNLASGDAVPVRRIAEMIRDRASPGLDLEFGAVPFGPNQIMHLEGDVSKLERAIGWRPETSLEEGLDRTVASATAAREGETRAGQVFSDRPPA